MEIYDAIILNEQSREWSSAVEALRVPDYLSDLRVDELACRNLVSFADSLAAEARDRVFALIRKHPEAHATVISLLRQVLPHINLGKIQIALLRGVQFRTATILFKPT